MPGPLPRSDGADVEGARFNDGLLLPLGSQAKGIRWAHCQVLDAMYALIIEDNYLISQSIRDLLEDAGYSEFGFARSEDAAIAGAADDRIDLITADVRLLPGDGLRAVRTICARRQIPVIFITAFAEELREREPSATIIQKPIKEAEFRAALDAALKDRRR